MKRSLNADFSEEEEDFSPKLKLCKFNHPTVPEVLFDDTSCNTVIILDDSISSELLHVKYSSESFIISFISNFETLLSTHEINQLLNDQTLSNSLHRITNMYCTAPDQNDFSFLSNITEPAIILYWIEHITGDILPRAFPYLSSNVKQNEQVIIELVENCCNLIIDELDFEKFDDILIIRIQRACRTLVDTEKMCNKLTMNQTLMLIDFTNQVSQLPCRIVNDSQFWEKCNPSKRAEVFEQNFDKLTNEVKNNKVLVLQWLKYKQPCFSNLALYRKLSKELQRDVDVCVLMVNDGLIPKWLNEEMKTNRNVLLKATQSRYFNYEELPKVFKHDQEFLLTVLKYDLDTFLKYNNHGEHFLMQAIETSNGSLFYHLSDSIRNDKQFIMKLLKQSSCIVVRILDNLGQELRNDKEFMLYLMKKDKLNFKYASETLRNDPELYNQVISNDYYSKEYRFLPEHLRTDINLILKHGSSLYEVTFIPPENIRNNKEIMMKLLQLGNGIYNYASNELKCDREFVMKAFDYDIGIEIDLNYWKDDLNVLLNIPNLNLETLSEPLRSNFNISVAAISNDTANLQFVSDNLMKDPDFVEKVFNRFHYSGWKYHIILPQILENKECVKQISKYLRNYFIFKYVNSDFEFMLSLVDDFNPLLYVSDELRNNKEFVKKVIEKHGSSFDLISKELQNDCEFILNLVIECPNLDCRSLITYCSPRVVGRVIQKYPELFYYVSSDFKKKIEQQQYFYEMSFLSLEIFTEYVINHPKNLPHHQELLKWHLRLKVNEKFKNSHLKFGINATLF